MTLYTHHCMTSCFAPRHARYIALFNHSDEVAPNCVLSAKTMRLVLYREVGVYYENRAKYTNALCAQNAEIFFYHDENL
jgi:hypothetical protein